MLHKMGRILFIALCHYPTLVPCFPAKMMASTTQVMPFLRKFWRYSVEDIDYTISRKYFLS